MEQAIDRYKELEKYLGLEDAKKEYDKLSEKDKQELPKFKVMYDVFTEMKCNAVDFEFLKEMFLNNKIALGDDFSKTYDEYKKVNRDNCLMTKFEYDEMRRILYGRNSNS